MTRNQKIGLTLALTALSTGALFFFGAPLAAALVLLFTIPAVAFGLNTIFGVKNTSENAKTNESETAKLTIPAVNKDTTPPAPVVKNETTTLAPANEATSPASNNKTATTDTASITEPAPISTNPPAPNLPKEEAPVSTKSTTQTSPTQGVKEVTLPAQKDPQDAENLTAEQLKKNEEAIKAAAEIEKQKDQDKHDQALGQNTAPHPASTIAAAKDAAGNIIPVSKDNIHPAALKAENQAILPKANDTEQSNISIDATEKQTRKNLASDFADAQNTPNVSDSIKSAESIASEPVDNSTEPRSTFVEPTLTTTEVAASDSESTQTETSEKGLIAAPETTELPTEVSEEQELTNIQTKFAQKRAVNPTAQAANQPEVPKELTEAQKTQLHLKQTRAQKGNVGGNPIVKSPYKQAQDAMASAANTVLTGFQAIRARFNVSSDALQNSKENLKPLPGNRGPVSKIEQTVDEKFRSPDKKPPQTVHTAAKTPPTKLLKLVDTPNMKKLIALQSDRTPCQIQLNNMKIVLGFIKEAEGATINQEWKDNLLSLFRGFAANPQINNGEIIYGENSLIFQAIKGFNPAEFTSIEDMEARIAELRTERAKEKEAAVKKVAAAPTVPVPAVNPAPARPHTPYKNRLPI